MQSLVLAAMAPPLFLSAAAQAGPAPGETIETRVEGDLNGDGRADFAMVTSDGNARHLRVFFATNGGAPIAAGHMPLPFPAPRAAVLRIDAGALTLENPGAGPDAIDATYVFQAAPNAPRMRLIRMRAEKTPKTIIWNLLTGDLVAARSNAAESGNEHSALKRTRRSVSILFMEETPDIGTMIDQFKSLGD